MLPYSIGGSVKKCIAVINKTTGKVIKESSLNEKQWQEFLTHVKRKPEEFSFEYETNGEPDVKEEVAPKFYNRTELKRMSIPKRKEVAVVLGLDETDPTKLTEAIVAKQTELFGE